MNLYITKHARLRAMERLGFERTRAREKLRWLFGASTPIDHSHLPAWYHRPHRPIPGTVYRVGRWCDKPVIFVTEVVDSGCELITVVTPSGRGSGQFPRACA